MGLVQVLVYVLVYFHVYMCIAIHFQNVEYCMYITYCLFYLLYIYNFIVSDGTADVADVVYVNMELDLSGALG
jgi:hypothetical protein